MEKSANRWEMISVTSLVLSSSRRQHLQTRHFMEYPQTGTWVPWRTSRRTCPASSPQTVRLSTFIKLFVFLSMNLLSKFAAIPLAEHRQVPGGGERPQCHQRPGSPLLCWLLLPPLPPLHPQVASSLPLSSSSTSFFLLLLFSFLYHSAFPHFYIFVIQFFNSSRFCPPPVFLVPPLLYLLPPSSSSLSSSSFFLFFIFFLLLPLLSLLLPSSFFLFFIFFLLLPLLYLLPPSSATCKLLARRWIGIHWKPNPKQGFWPFKKQLIRAFLFREWDCKTKILKKLFHIFTLCMLIWYFCVKKRTKSFFQEGNFFFEIDQVHKYRIYTEDLKQYFSKNFIGKVRPKSV